MTRYVNTKTGAVLDSSFKVSGGDWIKEKDAQEETEIVQEVQTATVIETSAEAPAAVEPQQDQTSDIDKVTKDQIMQELDGFKVKYNPRDKKEVLYDLMMSQGA